jgi:hypothetical protein
MSIDTEGCHLCTYVDYIYINTLFSSNHMLQMFVLFSMDKFVVHVDGIC